MIKSCEAELNAQHEDYQAKMKNMVDMMELQHLGDKHGYHFEKGTDYSILAKAHRSVNNE